MALAKRTDKQFNVRMPHEMHALLVEAADKNSRSINSEIVLLLSVALRLHPDFRGLVIPQQIKDTTGQPTNTDDWWGQAQRTAENFS